MDLLDAAIPDANARKKLKSESSSGLAAGQFTNDRDFPKVLLRLHNELVRAQALLAPGLLDDDEDGAVRGVVRTPCDAPKRAAVYEARWRVQRRMHVPLADVLDRPV